MRGTLVDPQDASDIVGDKLLDGATAARARRIEKRRPAMKGFYRIRGQPRRRSARLAAPLPLNYPVPGSPYRTPPHGTASMPIAYHTDDSALPRVVLAIMLAALTPPLTFGALSLWDALRAPAGAGEVRVPLAASMPGRSRGDR